VDPQALTALAELIGKFLPCRTLFGFKLAGLGAVVSAVAIGWSFRVFFNWTTLDVKVDGPDIGIAIAAMTTLVFLTIINAVLKARRDRFIVDLVPLTLDPRIDKGVKAAIEQKLIEL
jgi:hypothetical protein